MVYIITMKQTIKILSTLAEPTRLKAMRLMCDGQEHCVCELMKALKKSQPCMSRHMITLKKAGLVTDRRDAQWVRYRRNLALPKQVAALVKAALAVEKQTMGK